MRKGRSYTEKEIVQDPGISYGNLTRWCREYKQKSFIRDYSDEFFVIKMCQLLEVSCSGYYDWLNIEPSHDFQKELWKDKEYF